MAKVLVVDDQLTMLQMVSELLKSEGHQIMPFTSFPSACESLAAVAPELIIANLGSSNNSVGSMTLLRKTRSLEPQPLVIMVTPTAASETHIACVKHGAYDYLAKPFTPDEFRLRVQRALFYQAAVRENSCLRKQLRGGSLVPPVVGASPKIREILEIVERVAETDSLLLIHGPRGSGKQFIARTIHSKSRRRFAPFVALSCAAIPENLLEIELFGERKGLFPSLQTQAAGIFCEANGGTVLLEDVGALTIPLQSRLLTLLQQRRIDMPGETPPMEIDVRVLAATREDLQDQMTRGDFLPDLLQRFEIRVEVPALRERLDDLSALVAYFLEGKVHRRSGRPFEITREALDVCQGYDWPGNVRELESVLHHACMISRDGSIQLSDLPLELRESAVSRSNNRLAAAAQNGGAVHPSQPASAGQLEGLGQQECGPAADLVPLKRFLRDQEIDYLQKTLSLMGGSKERAAEVLGISLATIYRKLAEPAPSGEPANF